MWSCYIRRADEENLRMWVLPLDKEIICISEDIKDYENVNSD